MIITFPTALYTPVLPKRPTDPTSVTFTISSEDPPTSGQIFQQIPFAEEIRSLPARVNTPTENRTVMGDFVYSVSKAFDGEGASNTKQFEVGNFIDFGADENLDSLNDQNTPEVIDLIQNTNKLDLTQLNLDEGEVQFLVAQSTIQMEEIIDEINQIKAAVNDNEFKISENQKSINEVRKVIGAARVVLEADGSEASTILIKLIQQEKDLIEERESIIAETNALIAAADDKFQDLLRVRELVR